MLKTMFENVRKQKPLVHNITNYVTVNDCANALLACGGSPIMSDEIEEVEEITTICGGLNINIGTLNKQTIPAMFKAGKKANELGHPVVLDPVGAGASKLRTSTAKALMDELDIAVIKGNISEIKALALGGGTTRGVDADISDIITRDNLSQAVSFAKEFSKTTGAVIAITGAIDVVTDSEKAYCIFNGNPMMEIITGAGCQLSAVMAAYVTANPKEILEAAASAVCMMGICGEKAFEKMSKDEGNSSYRNHLIDAMYNITGEELENRAKIEVY